MVEWRASPWGGVGFGWLERVTASSHFNILHSCVSRSHAFCLSAAVNSFSHAALARLAHQPRSDTQQNWTMPLIFWFPLFSSTSFLVLDLPAFTFRSSSCHRFKSHRLSSGFIKCTYWKIKSATVGWVKSFPYHLYPKHYRCWHIYRKKYINIVYQKLEVAWYLLVRTCARSQQSLEGYGSAAIAQGTPVGQVPDNSLCGWPVLQHCPLWPEHGRLRRWESKMWLYRKPVGFRHLVPHWQKSPLHKKACCCCKSCRIGGRFQHRLLQGFSSTHGIHCWLSSEISLIHVRKQALPTCSNCFSCSVKNRWGIPQGKRWLRITFVLSRALEKPVQDGAIITANTRPLRISWRSRLTTLGWVKSWSGPFLMSHCFVK